MSAYRSIRFFLENCLQNKLLNGNERSFDKVFASQQNVPTHCQYLLLLVITFKCYYIYLPIHIANTNVINVITFTCYYIFFLLLLSNANICCFLVHNNCVLNNVIDFMNESNTKKNKNKFHFSIHNYIIMYKIFYFFLVFF